MKIDDGARTPNPLPTVVQAGTGPAKLRRPAQLTPAPAAVPPAPPTTDRVEVSDTGRAMQVATAALKQIPAIRADKVAELKARITAGTYQVPGEDIAERMLADDLLGQTVPPDNPPPIDGRIARSLRTFASPARRTGCYQPDVGRFGMAAEGQPAVPSPR